MDAGRRAGAGVTIPAAEDGGVAKTIYRVDEGSSGEASSGGSSSGSGPAPGSDRPRGRRLLWVVIGIVIVTLVMIVIIAALDASDSGATVTTGIPVEIPATVTLAGPATTILATTSTTEGARPTSTTSSSATTSTTLLTHAVADPARIVIPLLKVDTQIVPVGLTNGTEMEIPPLGLVGWYKLGPTPGASGPTVLVSHVSWNGKKGSFYRLKDLKAGDEVDIYGKSGDCAVFQVDSSETILKTKLPTEKIWNDTQESVIRLVTCGGAYDSKTGHYLSNVIVYGHLVR
jgi:sortase (surface protein transpeptidase)